MIKNSIDLAQILAAVCLEPYPTQYYKICQALYDCFKGDKKLFIYGSSEKQGIALNFREKLCNGWLDLKIKPFIYCSEQVLDLAQIMQQDDTILMLSDDKMLLEMFPNNKIIGLHEYAEKSSIDYKIPSNNPDRIAEVQTLLLNSLAEELLKHLV